MGLFTGPASAIKAARLLAAHPKLIGLALIPALTTCALSCVGIGLAIAYGDDLVTLVWAEPEEGWLHWLWWTLTQLVRLSAAFLAIFITPWLIILFGIPLSGPLASAADAILGGTDSSASLLASIKTNIGAAVGLTLIGMFGNILLFILGLPSVSFPRLSLPSSGPLSFSVTTCTMERCQSETARSNRKSASFSASQSPLSAWD